jgi:hypothetical protein
VKSSHAREADGPCATGGLRSPGRRIAEREVDAFGALGLEAFPK